MTYSLNYLIQNYLKKIKIFIDEPEFEFQLESHPSYPSLHSVTGVLDHFNIENLALEVETDEATLNQLPDNFLTILSEDGEQQYALVTKNKDKIDYLNQSEKINKIDRNTFLEKWSGIIVVAEDEQGLYSSSLNKKAISHKPAVVIFSLLMLGLFFISGPSILSMTFFAVLIVGTFLSITIVKHELGFKSEAVDKICSYSKATNCDAVINSKGASVLNKIKLSDLSLVYFVGLTLGWIILNTLSFSLQPVFYLSVLAFPMVVFSIYYQYNVVKSWCTLCLGVAAILTVLAAIGFSQINLDILSQNHLPTYIILVSVMLASYALWNDIRPLLEGAHTASESRIEFQRFRRNFKLFNFLLNENTPVNTDIPSRELIFGNPTSDLELVVITNPFCGHCKAVHSLIENILSKYSELIKVVIRINVNTKTSDSPGAKVGVRLLEIYDEDKERCLEAMHSIYIDNDFEQWIQEYGESQNYDKYFQILKTQNQWSLDNNFNFTPVLLINGQSYPKEYNREDLIYFIEDLNESCCRQENNIMVEA